jgi:hypothetical protein
VWIVEAGRWGEGEAAFSHRKRLGCERRAGNASVRSRATLALACTCRRLPRSCDILGVAMRRRYEGSEAEVGLM